MNKGNKLSNKAYNILSLIPAVAFAIFAGLMVVFAVILPVARVHAFGLNENYGSILNGTGFDEIAGLNHLSVILLVATLVTIIYAAVLLINRFSVLKYRTLFGKPLYKSLEVISVVFVLGCLLFAIAIIGRINAADEGLGIIRVASYPILAVILSIVCLLTVVISIALCNSHERSNPRILEIWKEERQRVKAEGKAPKAKKAANGAGFRFAKFLVIPIIAVISVTAASNGVVPRFEGKSFDADDLKQMLEEDAGKFELGKSSVENELGTSYVPKGASEDQYQAVYYTDNYIDFLGRLERNQRYALLAIEQGDDRISGLLRQAKNLEAEQETLAYGKAEITYDGDSHVKKVVYNHVVVDGLASFVKKPDKVQVFHVTERYSDQTNTTRKIEKVAYMATYSDGSFIYGACENAVVVREDGTVATTYEGSCIGKTIRWEDEFGKYEVVAPDHND